MGTSPRPPRQPINWIKWAAIGALVGLLTNLPISGWLYFEGRRANCWDHVLDQAVSRSAPSQAALKIEAQRCAHQGL